MDTGGSQTAASAWEKEREELRVKFIKSRKKIEKKIEETNQRIALCHTWEKAEHEGNLLKFHFSSMKQGASSVSLQDWLSDAPYVLSLDPSKTILEEMAARFKQAKKLRKGIRPLEEFLLRLQKELRLIEEELVRLDSIKTEEEVAEYKKTLTSRITSIALSIAKKIKEAGPALIYHEYRSKAGVPIWVGKTAKANEQLTFQLANGRDWWLHVKGYPGSHVIIRCGKDVEPDKETLCDAQHLALYYSKAKTQGEGEVCYTQRKFVSRLGRKKVGQVQIAKEHIAWIRLDVDRIGRLKKS